MYRFLFRLVPWWLWAVFAVAFAFIAVQIIETEWNRYHSLEQAKTFPAPRVIEAVEFDRRMDMPPSAEVAVAGLVQITPDPHFVEAAGPDLAYLIFMSRDTRKAFVAYSVRNRRYAFVEQVEAAKDAQGYTVLRGFLKGPKEQSALRQAAMDQLRKLELAPRDIFVIDPYRGTRDEGLRHEQGGAVFVGVAVFAIQALMVLVMFWKLRGSKKRRAQRRAAVEASSATRRRPAPKRGPWGASAAPARSTGAEPLRRAGQARARINDGFDESPIKSTKRWRLF